MRERPTNAAYFLAKVFHDAYYQAELEDGRVPIGAWSSLSIHDRIVMAQGFQKMLNLEIIQPIGLSGFMKLREARWECAASKREKAQRPSPSDLNSKIGGEEDGGQSGDIQEP